MGRKRLEEAHCKPAGYQTRATSKKSVVSGEDLDSHVGGDLDGRIMEESRVAAARGAGSCGGAPASLAEEGRRCSR
jgi:hypothetical protein